MVSTQIPVLFSHRPLLHLLLKSLTVLKRQIKEGEWVGRGKELICQKIFSDNHSSSGEKHLDSGNQKPKLSAVFSFYLIVVPKRILQMVIVKSMLFHEWKRKQTLEKWRTDKSVFQGKCCVAEAARSEWGMPLLGLPWSLAMSPLIPFRS